MAKKLPVNELLRLACIYAERDQLEYLGAVCDSDPDEVVKTKEFLKQIREYQNKRWGKTKLEAWMDSATEVPINKISQLDEAD